MNKTIQQFLCFMVAFGLAVPADAGCLEDNILKHVDSAIGQEGNLEKAGSAQKVIVDQSPLKGSSYLHEAPTQKLDKAALQKTKTGNEVRYFIDQDGGIHTFAHDSQFNPEGLFAIRSEGKIHQVQEVGRLRYNSQQKKYVMEADESYLKPVERKAAAKQSKDLVPDNAASAAKQKMLSCLDILNKQNAGKNFVLDRLKAENLVTTSAIVSTELLGAGRLQSREGLEVVAADLIGGNLSSIAMAGVGKYLVVNNRGLGTAIGTRAVTSLGLIELQRNVYNAVLTDEDPKNNSRSQDLSTFNQVHFALRLPINHWLDEALVKKLPQYLFESCQKGAKLSVFWSPTSVRIYERYASAVIYYGARSAVLQE
ncbi:MAG: hypothetical protein JNL01_06205 [Bdellovibrionales bacterium]|nr:hypothetical protein [Bdellovibrionales bacterium]